MIRVGDKVRHLIIVFRRLVKSQMPTNMIWDEFRHLIIVCVVVRRKFGRLVKRQMPADMTMNQKCVETP